MSYWRSVGYSQNTFFNEGFLDELAAAGKKDPLEVRRRLLAKNPRALAVLELAADKAGWDRPLPKGHGRGIAVVNNIGSFTAEIAEVSVINGKLRVHKVTCAVDCGHAVNPAGIEQQIQSGIVYGLSAALKGAITIDKGRVVQTNFNNYDVLRIDEMPVVEVHIMPSTQNPGASARQACRRSRALWRMRCSRLRGSGCASFRFGLRIWRRASFATGCAGAKRLGCRANLA